MANKRRQPLAGDSASYLERAESVILPRTLSETAPALNVPADTKLRVGVDLGTAYLVLVALDENGAPLAGEWQFAQVVRDGLVLDFIGAVDLLRGMKERLERRLGRALTHAASGYPPGVPQAEVRAIAHVLEAAGLECSGLLDEPTAANNVLHLQNGAIVDVGGGTTGIAVLKTGKVIHTADEATGGTHFTLVIAGALGISFEEAEALKTTLSEQPRLLTNVRPVMEKIGSIILHNTQGKEVPSITLVGGGSAFLSMAEVIQEYTGIPTQTASRPLFVTPLGLALHDPPQ
jgi:ethanolamine utilization protein EutJ